MRAKPQFIMLDNARMSTLKPIAQETLATHMRAKVVTRIRALIQANGWTQTHAASLCGVTQSRISSLIKSNNPRLFSLDTLVNFAAVLERHSQTPPQQGHSMEPTEQEAQRAVDEFMARLAARPIKGTYEVATLGSKTRLGGEVVTASSAIVRCGHRVACVGDVVRYPDGSESKIISGAGAAGMFEDKPLAIVGSATDNGDTITSSLQSGMQIREYADDAGIPGLLQPGYVATKGGQA